MSIEFNGQTGRVSAGYSLKIPAAADYSSEDAHASLSIEIDISAAETYEEAEKLLEQLEAKMFTTAKLMVFAQLGVEFDTNEGIMVPKLEASKPKPTRRTSSGGGSRGGGGGGTPQPKASSDRVAKLPRVEVDGVVYIDQRPLKEDGTYSPKAPDFKSVDKVDGQNLVMWIHDANGEENADVVDRLVEAGVDVEF